MIAIVGTERRGTSTLPTTAISSTDASNIYWDEYYYITKTDDVPELHELEIPKENKITPKFRVVKKLNNTMKVKTFVENRQLNFHIRNAL